MNESFQWLVHGEGEDINDSSSMHYNRHTIDNNKGKLVQGKKQVRFRVKNSAAADLEWQKNLHSQNHHTTLEYYKTRNRTHTIERNISISTR